MHCPVCNFKDSKVVDSRLSPDGTTIRRRRECFKCRYRFSTLEEIEILDLMVVKRDGRRESYNREKLIAGLRKALEKRPYTNESFQSLVHLIEKDIQKKRKREIKSNEIGEIVMNRLRGFDKVAYIRFASVYRSFEDAETFKKELENLLKSPFMKKGGKKKKRPALPDTRFAGASARRASLGRPALPEASLGRPALPDTRFARASARRASLGRSGRRDKEKK